MTFLSGPLGSVHYNIMNCAGDIKLGVMKLWHLSWFVEICILKKIAPVDQVILVLFIVCVIGLERMHSRTKEKVSQFYVTRVPI